MVPQANASVAHREIRHAALRMIGLAVFENIAHTSQRSNEGSTPIRVYLPAKTVDVNIDDIGIRLYPHTPDFIENHGPCDNAARISAQIFQKYEFLRRQIQDLAASGSLTPQQIQFEIEHSQASSLGDRRAVSLHQIAQPCKQLGKREWLGQVIVATLFEPSHTVIHRTPCRQDEYRRTQPKLSQPQDQAEAVFVGQAEIDDQRVMRALDGHTLGRPGIPRRFYLVSGFSQRTLQEALNFDFIFHQQQPHALMLMHSCRFSFRNRYLWLFGSQVRHPTS